MGILLVLLMAGTLGIPRIVVVDMVSDGGRGGGFCDANTAPITTATRHANNFCNVYFC